MAINWGQKHMAYDVLCHEISTKIIKNVNVNFQHFQEQYFDRKLRQKKLNLSREHSKFLLFSFHKNS